MTEALAFDDLVQALHHQLAALPDDRRGRIPSTRSKMPRWGRLRSSLPNRPPFWPINGRCNGQRAKQCGPSLRADRHAL